jgi:hypothetical protein
LIAIFPKPEVRENWVRRFSVCELRLPGMVGVLNFTPTGPRSETWRVEKSETDIDAVQAEFWRLFKRKSCVCKYFDKTISISDQLVF